MSKILVIDDEKSIRIILKKVIEAAGHSVTTAENGPSGIAIWEQESPDLVITDIVMPEMSGFEVIDELMKRDPKVLIIAITAYTETDIDEQLGKAKEAGVVGAMRKPIDFHELLEVINDETSKQASTV